MPFSRNKKQDEVPTNPTGKLPSHSDLDHTVGQLMVESLNHRHRIEILESLAKRTQVPPGSLPPPGNNRILPLIRKTVATTVVIIAAIISALKELGYLGLH